MCYVLRLEDSEGKGIYSGGIATMVCTEIDRMEFAFSDSKHPMPFNDSALRLSLEKDTNVSKKYKGWFVTFGFKDFWQFRSWFYSDKFLELCKRMGIVLNVYFIRNPDDNLAIGNSQCVFDKEAATLIATLDPLCSVSDIEAAINNNKKAEQ